DLILSPNIFEPEMIEQLEEIAPVYQFTLPRRRPRELAAGVLGKSRDAVNKTDQLDELDREFDLILSPNIFEPEMIEQLEEIAPVYQFTLPRRRP
ncbi:hypothetical protein CSW77_26650, partial [Shigella flexneri]